MTDKTKWHMLSEKDLITKTALCSICGPVYIHPKLHNNENIIMVCSKHKNQRHKKEGKKARHSRYRNKIDLSKCSLCGFIPEHLCQIDVDHINTIHTDNRPENLQALCANCHRLKTYKEKLNIDNSITMA